MKRAVIFVAALSACSSGGSFTGAEVLGGEEISAATLNSGQRAYSYYCVACHGAGGDGRGPAAVGLDTPPRDFRIATYKFSGIAAEDLPRDEDLARIVVTGLDGTAMLRWHVPDSLLFDIIQYTKTFSPEQEGWRDPDMEIGEPIDTANDPWAGRAEEAVHRGEKIYHGQANCHLCHPAYVAPSRVNEMLAEYGKPGSSPRPNFWLPEPKLSTSYTAPIAGDPICESASDCDQATQVCRYGICERQLVILPPDFTVNEVRSGDGLPDLFRVIAAGIPGTAMPRWKDALPDEDLWAMAYYIRHLMDMKGTPQVAKLKRDLRE